jgi:hypothetical protein
LDGFRASCHFAGTVVAKALSQASRPSGGHKAEQWPKSVFDLRAKFPGYQPGHRFRENMKHGDVPADDAPLSEWAAKMIDHAKAKWSGEIDGRKTRLQFKEWLPHYLDNDRFCWTGHPKLVGARELLRIACGMPRFAPTRRAC